MRWGRKASRGAKRTEVDGVIFASKLEAKRYGELKVRQLVGEIRDLSLQPVFKLSIGDVLVCKYIPDFLFLEGEKTVAEDAKGFLETHTRIKIKLAQALYPHIEFRLWPERVRKKRVRKLRSP